MFVSGVSSKTSNLAGYNFLNTKSENAVVNSENEINFQENNNNNSVGVSAFEKILSSLLGTTKKSSPKTGNISKYGIYSAKGFDSSINNFFESFMKGMTLSKAYTELKYQKVYKDARDFEELLRKLMAQAQKDNKAAGDALAMIASMLNDLGKTTNDPQEKVSKLMQGIKDYIKSFEQKNPDGTIRPSESDPVFNILNGAINSTVNESGKSRLNSISAFAERSKKFDDMKSEQDFADTMLTKVKRNKKFDPNPSTKKYLKNRKREEEVNEKISQINRFRTNSEQATANVEISQIINDISKIDINESSAISSNFNHITDIKRLNRNVESPLFG